MIYFLWFAYYRARTSDFSTSLLVHLDSSFLTNISLRAANTSYQLFIYISCYLQNPKFIAELSVSIVTMKLTHKWLTIGSM